VGDFRVTKVWAYVAVDDDGDEGFPAFVLSPGILAPMIGADEVRVASLRPHAVEVAARRGVPVRLVVFEGMRELEVIQPPKARGRG
jgi:hypothetical protein